MNAMNSNRNIVSMSNKIGKSGDLRGGGSDTSISSPISSSELNNLNIDDIFRFMELYFNRAGIMYSHLYNSMNKFLDEDVKVFLENGDHTFFEKIDKNKIYKYKFKYENVTITPPMMENGVEPMFPSDARNRSLVYGGRLMARVTQLQETIDIATDERKTRICGQPEENVPIANMPLMLRSAYCSLNLYKGYDKTECEYDPGGYFIVNGSEKVVIAQDRMCDNKPLVFIKKESGADIYTVQVNSKSHKPHGIAQAVMIRLKKDGILTIRVPIISEIPVLILFRALGVESDRDIINYIAYDDKDHDLVDALRISLEECKNEKGIKIQTKEDAILYLMGKMRVIKKYSETDKNVKQQQKKLHLLNLLEFGFLPHVEGNTVQKAVYLGYMINRLLKCYIGRIPKDDRDSYINKRIDLPGTLIDELFRQFYRKMMNECTKFFKKRNPSDEDPIVVINQIKPNVIEQGLKTALLTGSWIRRKGVAQMLQRYTYLQTLSFLRRVDAPGGDASTSKLTSPRELHPSSVRWLCCVAGDTKILMADGTHKLIKDMKNGDNVKIINTQTNKLEISKIKNWFVSPAEPLYKIETVDGNEIKCTFDHKLYVNRKGKFSMIQASDIKNNDRLCSLSSSNKNVNPKYVFGDMILTKIKKISVITEEPVYDFETESNAHNFIGNNVLNSNCIQTPEHAKVGMTKHFSIIGNVSIMQTSQIPLIKSFLKKKIMNVQDVSPETIKDYTKIFFNGEWMGLSADPFKLKKNLDENKLNGTFDPVVSIIHDIVESEIRIYCDGGRGYAPAMKVKDNVVQLTRKHIDSISLNKSDAGKKITSWEEFMLKNPGIIEYIDMEEQPYLLFADKIARVEEMRQRMINSIAKVKDVKSNKIDNRYDESMFVKYTHCEFHPSFLIGEISTNIPFCNSNQGPRNIFQ